MCTAVTELEVPVLVCLPEYDGCPCVCAERLSWMSLTCCDSHPPTTLYTQYQNQSHKAQTFDWRSSHTHIHV